MVLGLLLSGNAYANEAKILYKDEKMIHIAHKGHINGINFVTGGGRLKELSIATTHCKSYDKYAFYVSNTTGLRKYYKKKKLLSINGFILEALI